MRRVANTILFAIVGLVLMLAAVALVVISTLATAEIQQPIAHAFALAGTLLLGTVALCGATFLTTQAAVRFAGERIPKRT